MHLPFSLLLVLLAQSSFVKCIPAKRSYDTHHYYVIAHDPHSDTSLDDVARSLNVEIVERAGELENHWLVRTPKPLFDKVGRDKPSDRVLQLFEDLRTKANSNSPLQKRSEAEHARRIVSSVKYLSKQTLRRRVKRAPPLVRPPDSSAARATAARLGIQDPWFPRQWHLINDEYPEHMMNITGLWDMGYTGKGIISSFVDDGLDYTSKDLAANFDADDSYDFNEHVALPTPSLPDDHHGTRCAGQVAAIKNDACGVGIAYESKVAGVRILSGPISDVDEAAALNYGFQNVSLYSCSWGPPDNGRSMEGPGHLVAKAVVNGINNGRGGKGSVFVFASGNGGGHDDQCNFDGYTNSIYSVTVSSVDYKGLHPYYSEACAANMIVAYSSGSGQHIVTTDKGENQCTSSHGGTSAAAPNAVGVFALALQVRPELTWRDIQYLCMETALVINPEDPDWERTASGKLYSYKYGFGVLDGYKYVMAAKDWKLVKPQTWLETKSVQLNGGKMDSSEKYSGGEFIAKGGVTSTITITQDMLQENNFEALEHINVKVWINHSRRGDVSVEIVSPNGVISVLASPRVGDTATTGFPGWTFMTVKHWGENPVGNWKIRVSDKENYAEHNGTFLGWNMVFWGAAIDPDKTRKFELQPTHDIFPPDETMPTPVVSSGSTKTHPRPTEVLPSDHAAIGGENSLPAFPSTKPTGTNGAATSTSIVAPDEGWFSDMSKLISSQKWFFGALAVVTLFGIGAGVFFCWRRHVARQRRAAYTSLSATEEMTMSSLEGGQLGARSNRGGRTKELYDAFGEVSDDEDDADEQTHLRAGPAGDRSPQVGLGFHSGFLDDDEPTTTAGMTPIPEYRDEPDEHERGHREPPEAQTNDTDTPSESGGSWEHASRD
ncbi:hypothetical protein AMATHDRAFT_135595 [Amanita thiersii Skay4041]|uniref:P/Homo B domain-containing protein n=1 Tax=Amanita thiersii Skay4041 TaxID=703135 RepID=A0A2A9P018_9AGAR|nr:hypothetical protein AMATHDRAFT_135595 [Amanita thiersii Skay4041]